MKIKKKMRIPFLNFRILIRTGTANKSPSYSCFVFGALLVNKNNEQNPS